jgi:molybdate transport system ATP-binding protein
MTLSVQITHRLAGFTLDVAFQAPSGVTALFGRSGAGKTSVVNAVAGLLRPETGRIVVADRVLLDTAGNVSLPVHKRQLGYVFQGGRLFPHLSVAQNLTYGRWFGRHAHASIGFDQVVAMLGLEGLLTRRPGALSGGETQRVAIGRALLADPRLLLMDEPFAALDTTRKAEILPYLERLRDETAIPILYVSHDLNEVARLATTVVALDAGRVTACGPTAVVLSDPQAASGLGIRDAGAVLTGRIVAQHADGLTELALGTQRMFLPQSAGVIGASIQVRVAAQDVLIARTRPQDISALNILTVTIIQVHFGDGPGAMVQLDLEGEKILARVTRRSADALGLRAGVECYAILKSVGVAKGNVTPQNLP